MLFNSKEFIFIFLPIVFIIYFAVDKKNTSYFSKVFLVSTSLFFYGWWNILYLPIIILSILFNFKIGCLLSKTHSKFLTRKVLLVIGISVNLLLLGYFKYSDFLIVNLNFVLGSNISLLNLTLPLAISFFTFQQIAYLVDSYKGETNEYDILNYSVFVTFFPQLIAGPIVHHKEMMPQFVQSKNININYKNISVGLLIFSMGLFKKVVIADSFAVWANNGFESAGVLYFYEAWATSLSYTFQLYFDFSGYSDMAIGLALLFNIKLPFNFNSPYKALSIQDFWRRWHMTLSRFLRDYIYIPLGGNKISNNRTYLHIMITFVLGGIWHGAGWTFVVWGCLHGLALVINRIWNTFGLTLWKWLAWIVTFTFVNITWVFFRANTWGEVTKVLKGMFGLANNETFLVSLSFIDKLSMWFNQPLYNQLPYFYRNAVVNEMALFFSLMALFFVLFAKNSNSYQNIKPSLKTTFFAAFLFSISIIISLFSSSEVFLYFNF